MNNKLLKTSQQPIELGKIPPQAIDMEEAALGSIMLEKGALSSVINVLTSEAFYKESHQRIFAAIHRLFTKSEPVDILTVTSELKTSGELELVGGAYYITQLTNRVASTANVEFHARIITQKYIQRELIRISSMIIKDAFKETTDVFDLVDKIRKSSNAINNLLFKGRMNIEHVSKVAEESIKDLAEKVKFVRKGGIAGVNTPFKNLNKTTGGWRNGDLIILAGRPGMGKTAIALAFAAKSGVPTTIFSLEMASKRLGDRMIISQTDVDAEKYRNGYLSDTELAIVGESMNYFSSSGVYIDDTPSVNVEYIRMIGKEQKDKGQLGLIIIDYLQLMEGDKNYRGNRENEVATISRKLKGIAKELDVPIILLAQLNRAVESRTVKRPMLSDLRESGAIEQDADMVMFAYRPEYYGITQETREDGSLMDFRGVGLIIIAKHREGALIDVPFRYNNSLTQLTDYVFEQVPDEINAQEDTPF